MVTFLKGPLYTYAFPYYIGTVISIGHLVNIYMFQNTALLLLFIYGIMPIFDIVLNVDSQNPTKEEQKKMRNKRSFMFPIYLHALLSWAVLIVGLYYIVKTEVNVLSKLTILYSMVTNQSASTNLAHELFHKKDVFHKFLGVSTLSKIFFMHFYIEHNYGHHRNVATEEDPASSRYNETFYQFLPRTMIGSFTSAWKIEKEFCLIQYGSKYSIYNKMIYFTASMIIVPFLIWTIFSFQVMTWHLIVSFLSISQLEMINYIEHYGLSRNKLQDGSYEKVGLEHSWDSPHRISNYLFYKTQRHSDHHVNSRKPYQNLCTNEVSPTLPFGYVFALQLCLTPKKWFDVMNPLIEAYKLKKELSLDFMKDLNHKIKKTLIKQNILWALVVFFSSNCFV
jgi:alkane 1-monooxygenase